ncbi:MAG: tRNA-dihydrouridine synthase family protein [Kiritimatiellae bacterium]|nr:tRNA-dihydrouridine synthase family protein [Kiritimatiellia bacterium]
MKIYLAPLADFTDAPFRRMCYEGGADMVYTEMVSAAALAHGNSPTRHLMETMGGEGCVACQIFGANESDVAIAAREVEKIKERFVELNLNAGCPMTRITRSGAGAKLIEEPEKVFRLLKAMRENTSLPITLKTRLGPHPKDVKIFELVSAAEGAGAKGVAVHARFTSQMHGGALNLELLKEVVERSNLPITGNGSIKTLKDIEAMSEAGVKSVMIGRAALADPGIFAALKGGENPWSRFDAVRAHLKYILEFRELLALKYPNDHIRSIDAFASVKMHTHLFRYFNGIPGAAKLRANLNKVRTLAEIETIIEDYSKAFLENDA